MNLEDLKPKFAMVMVGDGVNIKMGEPSILQAEALLRVASEVELEQLVEPIVGLMGKDSSAGAILAKLVEVGPALVEVARPILGRQFAPAVRSAAIACLDTREVFRALISTKIIESTLDRADADSDGAYVGSPEVRAYLKEHLTLKQAVYVLQEAVGMADFVGAVGNVVAAFMPEEAEAEEPKKPAVKSKRKGA